MKGFLVFVIIVNTVFFGATAFFSMQSYKLMEKNNVTVKASLDTMNFRIKSINASLDDKLYGIMSNLPRR